MTTMTTSQVAKHFGVSQKTIQRWIAAGKLKADKIDGRWLIHLDVPDEGQWEEEPHTQQMAKLTQQIDHLAQVVAMSQKNIVANPPYVPTPPNWQPQDIIETAWNAGPNGRMIIDHIIKELPRYLKPNGRFVMVQSSLSNIPKTQNQLKALGFESRILAKKWLPLGPVSCARLNWLKTHAPIVHPNTELLVVLEATQAR